jgi:hypothetical protein
MMSVEQSVEWELVGETAPLPLCPPQIPTWADLGSKQGRRSGKSATNHLSYGTVQLKLLAIKNNSTEKFHGSAQHNWNVSRTMQS